MQEENVPKTQKENIPEKDKYKSILESLLESSKTTGELAIELGYVNSEKKAQYPAISRELIYLKKNGYIEVKKEKRKEFGRVPNLYSISNTQNLRKILDKYPDLIFKMLKSNLVHEIALNQDPEHPPSKEDEEYFKELFKSSPEFLELFLGYDKSKLLENIEILEQDVESIKSSRRFQALLPDFPLHSIETLFYAFITVDMQKGRLTEEGIKYLEKRRAEKIEAHDYIEKFNH